MKWFLFIALIAAVAVWYFFFRPPAPQPVPVAESPAPPAAAAAPPTPPPAPAVHEKHIAQAGTYFLLEPVSMTTDSGVIGVAVGTRVTVMNAKGKTWHVTDGATQFDVAPDALTNDLDIAAGVIQQEAEKKAALQSGIRSQEESADRAEKARQQGAAWLAKQLEFQRQQQPSPPPGGHPGQTPEPASATGRGGTPPPFGRPGP